MTYRYNASVWGRQREDLEYNARSEAEAFFETSELNFLGAEVTLRIPEGGTWEYVGVYSYGLKDDAPSEVGNEAGKQS